MQFHYKDFAKYLPQLQKVLLTILLLQLGFLLVTFFKYGTTLSTDTLMYYSLANDIKDGNFPYSVSYTPAYSFFAAVVSGSLGLSLAQAGFLISLTLFFLSTLIIYAILKQIELLRENRQLLFVFTLLIVNSWWSIRILLNAHADGLLYLFHLLVVFFLLRFLKSEKISYYVVSCFIAALAIWAKKNAIVYLPFLTLVPLLFFGVKQKIFLGLIPVALSGLSYYILKSMNGTVLRGLEKSENVRLWGEEHQDALLTNLADSGTAIVSGFATDKAASLLPGGLLIAVTITLALVLTFFVLRHIGSKKIEAILFSFPILYLFGMGLLFQLTGHTEMNQRTLFPAIFALLFGSLWFFCENKSRLGVLLLAIFLITQPLRTFAGTFQWYKRAPMDSFVFVNEFTKKDSLKRLDELMKLKGLTPDRIYTNNSRYLTIYFNYKFTSDIPRNTSFLKGKRRAVNEVEMMTKREKLLEELNAGKAIVAIYDDNIDRYCWLNENSQLHVEKIDGDLVMYKQ